jgi:hypothetical protein
MSVDIPGSNKEQNGRQVKLNINYFEAFRVVVGIFYCQISI